MVDDLMDPSAFPENTKNILLAQTHISNVFISDKFVYKIKKPVNFGFLDFSTLEKRKYYCNEEVDLNNRFSTGIYLGVIPVTYDGSKHSIGGKGKIVDYAVKMRRLSDEDLLKTRFKKGIITLKDIERMGKAIATIHKNAVQSKKIKEFGKIEAVKLNTDENFQQTEEFIDNSILKEQFDDLRKWTEDFYKNFKDIFKQRMENGKIRDCHGDLHMEHVCLTDPIIIFDCIEFNERFRYIDIASDIAFLLMDLEYNGGKDFSEQLYYEYIKHADEADENLFYKLVTFYKVYRAYVRGKVTSFILNDSLVSDTKKNDARNIAQNYFALAHSYIFE
jgi:aminoglycoside phosphotransferase family enzyme